MLDLTRRRFLAWSGMTAATAMLGDACSVDVADLLSPSAAGSTDPVLVLVTLYGGNDGLNTVVPAGDAVYQSERRDLAYRPEELLDLGGGLGLNPGMPRLHGLWTDGTLAILPGVGYPKPDHSHFRSMAIWHTASPETSVPTGWLGRWLDATGDDPLRAISLETTAPPFLAGAKRAGSTIRPSGLQLPTGANGEAFRMLAAPDPSDSPSEARAAGSVADLHTVAGAVNDALAAGPGSGALAAQLDAVAALLRAGAPTRVYSVSITGFDTHADERGTQQALLSEVDTAIGRFVDGTSDVDRPVVTAVYSEFGRRVRANASQGTDHGTAGPMFVFGTGVRGGMVGDRPALSDLDDGDLRFTTDFRDVYASLLEQVLRTDPAPSLGSWSGRVPLLA